MTRTDIRTLIKEFLANAGTKVLSSHLSDKLAAQLRKQYPDRQHGNVYNINCEYDDLFNMINGRIDRCDSFEQDSVMDSVSFAIDKDLRVEAWDQTPAVLTLDMNDLSEDDLVDISHMNDFGRVDVYKTFMRTPAKDRGKLAAMIPHARGLELFDEDIPPYAFYQYEGKFYSFTGKAVGDLGGGVGFGGSVRALGTVAEISSRVVVIGEHAFDGCRNLTEVYLPGNVHYVGKHAFANIPGLIIRCGAASKPALWDDQWCDENCTVYFRD